VEARRDFCSSCITNKSNSYNSGTEFFISTESKKNSTSLRSWAEVLALAEANVKKTCTEIYDLGMLLSYLFSFKPHVFQVFFVRNEGLA